MKNNPFQPLTLDTFESIISPTILERGLAYYQEGAILSIEQIEKGIWEAIISGSENYEVAVRIHNNTITKSNCTCPYDLGDYCKHEVAVFNFLKYSDLAKKPPSDKMKKIRTILSQFSKEELHDNLLEILKNHKEVRSEFLENYDSAGEGGGG